MSASNGFNAGEPREDRDKNEQNKPRGRIARGARGLGLTHPHAPHWAIAILTAILAVFAYKAWVESRRATEALQGQLEVLKIEQRPFVGISNDVIGINTGEPFFIPSTGQIAWNFAFKNFGRSVAYHLTQVIYINIAQTGFELSNGFIPNASYTDLPPNGIGNWATAYSRPGFSKDYFDTLMKQESSIEIRVNFQYYDASLSQKYTSGFCLMHHPNGTMGFTDAEECH
jgi:hypothetical protein